MAEHSRIHSDGPEITDDTPILDGGHLTSLDIVEFVLFIEELRDREIDTEELDPDAFASVNAIHQSFFAGMGAERGDVTSEVALVPHDAEHRPGVRSFNERMRAGGSRWRFYEDPEPDWIPRRADSSAWREYHVLADKAGQVRGGVALKPQQWLIDGRLHTVTDWQGPFTEAEIDSRYSPLVLKCLRGVERRYPLLFSLGHGGTDEPIVRFIRTMKWRTWGIPFCFRVFKPFRFLRRNAYLRRSWTGRLALDLAAFSGLGAVLLKGLQALQRMRAGWLLCAAVATEVPEFGEWADDLWVAHAGEYRCLAVRDRQMMNALLPASGWPGGTRLRVNDGEEVIGWSVVNIKQLQDDERFGDLKVAMLTDCFGSVTRAAEVVAATVSYIRSRDIDLAFANISHPVWVDSLRSAGFIVLEDRRVFALSPALEATLQSEQDFRSGLHLTNMDGHGPHGFATS